MSDIYNSKERSAIMSKISGKDTKPEILVRKYLFSQGFRYRKNDKRLPGKPDIVLPKYKTVIFIHGCFWHGHSCKKGKLPEKNYKFWQKKITDNIKRDHENIKRLKDMGWNVIIVWQCQIKNYERINRRLNELISEIKINL
jgi:DNA mismatch endonuclease (patch repair protein)